MGVHYQTIFARDKNYSTAKRLSQSKLQVDLNYLENCQLVIQHSFGL